MEAASRFNVQGTSPKLQYEFCTLWNQIVLKVQNEDNRTMAFEILGPIRNIYSVLHPNTDSVLTRLFPSTGDEDDILRDPSSYPGCNVTGHIHDDSASTTFTRTALHDNAALALDPVTARVIQGGMDTTAMTPLPTPEPSASTSPLTSIASAPNPRPGAVAVQRITDRRNSPDGQGVPSLRSPAPNLYNMLPTESHSSLPTPAIPAPSRPRLSSPPDPGSATEAEGSMGAALHERNTLDPPLAIRETIMATPDFSSQSPSSSSVAKVAGAGPSRPSLGAEHTGDQPLNPSHGRYNIV